MSSRKLPSTVPKPTREFHDKAKAEDEKAKIVEVAQQDPQHVLLHSTEAGNPYHIIGDIYDEKKYLELSTDWAIDTYTRHLLAKIESAL
jgi:hypothetical protein